MTEHSRTWSSGSRVPNPESRATTVCLGCGCACDDIDLVIQGERIVEARNACALGVAWFGDGRVPARVRAQGRDVGLAEAAGEAARLLKGTSRPLVYLAPELSCEAQREAVALADVLRATLDTITSAALPSILAAQERGRAGATLGEIRNRADVIVFWGVDPAARYPRYWSRYAPEPGGVHVTEGRRSRVVVSVDVGTTRGPDECDVRAAVGATDEVAVLTALTALAQRRTDIETQDAGPTRGGHADADPLSIARRLSRTLLAGRYVAIVADAEPDGSRDAGRAAALVALSLALNGATRCALSTLRGGGNRSGADAVLTSQTGYPLAVDFSRGYPRYRPYEATAAARLERRQVDAVVVLGAASAIDAGAAAQMRRVPCVVIGPRASESVLGEADVVIDTGVAGIHEAGTALRMDDVPLPLRAALGGAPAAAEVITTLVGLIREDRHRH